jgi:hypothetical protein
MSYEELIKQEIKEFEQFHKTHKPYENCKSITKREIALYVLLKRGQIKFKTSCVDSTGDKK